MTIDLAAARGMLRELTPRRVALVTAIPDLDAPMPGSDWSAGEAAAHLVVGVVDYTEHANGAEACYHLGPADRAGRHRRLGAMVEEDGHHLAGKLQLGADAFLDATAGRAGEDLVRWHAGYFLPCNSITGILLGEQLLHGYDIAHTVGASWPIEPEAARLVIQALMPLLPRLVDTGAIKGVDASYELDVDGGPRVVARFRDGGCTIDPPDREPASCRLSGDPITWLLAIYGRVRWEQLLRTGRVKVTHGDASRAAGFKRLFRNP